MKAIQHLLTVLLAVTILHQGFATAARSLPKHLSEEACDDNDDTDLDADQ